MWWVDMVGAVLALLGPLPPLLLQSARQCDAGQGEGQTRSARPAAFAGSICAARGPPYPNTCVAYVCPSHSLTGGAAQGTALHAPYPGVGLPPKHGWAQAVHGCHDSSKSNFPAPPAVPSCISPAGDPATGVYSACLPSTHQHVCYLLLTDHRSTLCTYLPSTHFVRIPPTHQPRSAVPPPHQQCTSR